MQWSTEPHGGFTKTKKPILPVISGGAYGYQHVKSPMQRRDPNSLLNWMERIIRMRKEVPEIGWGDLQCFARDSQVLAIRYDWRGNSVVIVHNLSAMPQEVRIAIGLEGEHGKYLVNVLSDEHSSADDSGHHCILMEAYGYRWYRAGGLKHVLNEVRGVRPEGQLHIFWLTRWRFDLASFRPFAFASRSDTA